jgi:hypothetical protein
VDVALGYGLRPQEAAVVRGMVPGDRSLIPLDLEDAFQRSGITQVLPSTRTTSREEHITQNQGEAEVLLGDGFVLERQLSHDLPGSPNAPTVSQTEVSSPKVPLIFKPRLLTPRR